MCVLTGHGGGDLLGTPRTPLRPLGLNKFLGSCETVNMLPARNKEDELQWGLIERGNTKNYPPPVVFFYPLLKNLKATHT